MVTLSILEKTRCINKILQNSTGQYVDYKEICEVLRDTIHANVYISNMDGKILGYSLIDEFDCELMVREVLEKEFFPERYNGFLLKSDELRDNLKQKPTKTNCVFVAEENCLFKEKIITIIPILGGGDRLGTLLLARFGKDFNEEDLLLAERGATVVGMEILRSEAEEAEEKARNQAVVELAMSILSYSELEAVEQIFKELNSEEGLLVASKIADQLGITRSVIVNALRKFESAGIIESRSLGMKGTYIRVLNPYLYDYLKKNDNKRSGLPWLR
jgi:transcriptional pleiotropic repressor